MFQLCPDILVIDNFYDDPISVRNLALNSEYYPNGYSNGFKNGSGPFPGKMSKEPFLPKQLDTQLSKMLGKHLFPRRQSDHGYFRISKITDAFDDVIHSDSRLSDEPSNKYVGIVYLSLPEHSKEITGTTLYKHKPTNMESLLDEAHQEILKDTNAFADIDQWEPTFACKFKFNRLFIYPPHRFHKIGNMFGDTDENSRLVQLFSWGEII